MSHKQGSGGMSGIHSIIPPHGAKRNDGGRPTRNKYKDVKPSEQRNTSEQRRVRRQHGK